MQTALIPFRRTLTKQDLCKVFDLVSATGRCYYDRLRSEIFTATMLEAIEMQPDRYKEVVRGKHFTYEETQRIIRHFELTPDELSEL